MGGDDTNDTTLMIAVTSRAHTKTKKKKPPSLTSRIFRSPKSRSRPAPSLSVPVSYSKRTHSTVREHILENTFYRKRICALRSSPAPSLSVPVSLILSTWADILSCVAHSTLSLSLSLTHTHTRSLC